MIIDFITHNKWFDPVSLFFMVLFSFCPSLSIPEPELHLINRRPRI